ncbi:MAG: hypothetical protein KTR31_06100 [Myxococcales bacterium]|nr:hypothetical protein [Myxococcales bacterium]
MRSSLWVLTLLWACEPPTLDSTTLDGADADTDADADADADTDADTDSDADTDVGCGAPPDGTDPWVGHPLEAAGAAVTTKPYDFDAGVGEVEAAAIKAGTTQTDVSLAVAGAVVVSKGFISANSTFARFWFADSTGAMVAYIDDPKLLGVVSGLNPGDEISFTATSVVSFFDTPQLRTFDALTVDSTGNDVFVVDGNTGAELTYDDHGESVINVYGQLVALQSADCGGSSLCYDFDYGKGQTITYRTASNYDTVGDCLHFIGPMVQFSGAPQLNVDDFDWDRWY